MHDARSGAKSARCQCLEPRGGDVVSDDLAFVLHGGRKRQRFAPGTRREVEHAHAGCCAAKQRGKLRRFVLNLESALQEQRRRAQLRVARRKTNSERRVRRAVHSETFGAKLLQHQFAHGL